MKVIVNATQIDLVNSFTWTKILWNSKRQINIENHFEKVQQAVREPLEELETKLRDAMKGGAATTGEIIDLEEFKNKKTWKPKLI